MISNKEKRLSQAYDVYASSQLDGPPPPLPPMLNHHQHHLQNTSHANHIAPYGMIGSAAVGNNNNGSATRAGDHLAILGKKGLNNLNNSERNSHSLSHDFSNMYISNLKSHTQANSRKYADRNGGTSLAMLPSLEEMNSAKRDAAEARKQMSQMEKVFLLILSYSFHIYL